MGHIFKRAARVTWVKTFFTWLNIFRGSKFLRRLRGSKFFAWVSFFYVVQNFLHESKFLVRHFWGVGSKEISTLSLQYFAYFFGLHYVQAAKLQVKVN